MVPGSTECSGERSRENAARLAERDAQRLRLRGHPKFKAKSSKLSAGGESSSTQTTITAEERANYLAREEWHRASVQKRSEIRKKWIPSTDRVQVLRMGGGPSDRAVPGNAVAAGDSGTDAKSSPKKPPPSDLGSSGGVRPSAAAEVAAPRDGSVRRGTETAVSSAAVAAAAAAVPAVPRESEDGQEGQEKGSGRSKLPTGEHAKGAAASPAAKAGKAVGDDMPAVASVDAATTCLGGPAASVQALLERREVYLTLFETTTEEAARQVALSGLLHTHRKVLVSPHQRQVFQRRMESTLAFLSTPRGLSLDSDLPPPWRRMPTILACFVRNISRLRFHAPTQAAAAADSTPAATQQPEAQHTENPAPAPVASVKPSAKPVADADTIVTASAGEKVVATPIGGDKVRWS